jgi:hypothetical protein
MWGGSFRRYRCFLPLYEVRLMGTVVLPNLAAPFGIPYSITSPKSGDVSSSAGGLSLFSEDLAGGSVGSAYSQQLKVTGGTAPYTFALSSGSLPVGLELVSGTGLIFGTPTAVGTSTFSLCATDSDGLTSTQTFRIAMVAAAAGSGGGNYGWIG